MKIGILTQPLKSNYGGILQNYALQMVLKKMGHKPLTLARNKKSRVSIWKHILIYTLREIGVKRYSNYITLKEERRSLHNLNFFVSEKISKTQSIYSTQELKKVVEREAVSAIIVGSDQVWRPRYSPNINNYFLDFAGDELLKISYASSFGVEEWEFDDFTTSRCKILAQKFKAISVREDSAVNLCSRYLGVRSYLVLDPTLLLKKSEYEQIFSLTRYQRNKKYIYAYMLDMTVDKYDLLTQFAKEKGMELIIMSCEPKQNGEPLPPIGRWLGYIYNAEYVITDSFHGTIFSILFNKRFLSIGNRGRGLDRFRSILRAFEIEERLLVDDLSIQKLQNIVKSPIDYDSLNMKIESLREYSVNFLKTNLGES